MTVTDSELSRGKETSAFLPRHVRGLLWREWLAHRPIAVGALAIYLVLGWALLIFFNPWFVLIYGVVLVKLAGAAVAGQEPIEGSEEFALSLPPARAERYLVRLALWGGAFLFFLIFATLSIAFDLPQRVWGLFVQTGFTEPFPAVKDRWLYAFAVAGPFAAFAFTFVVASLARTRGAAMWSAFLGTLGAAAVVLAGLLVEFGVWCDVNGYVTVPLLGVTAAAALALGYVLYLRKEGISRPAPIERRGGGWIVAVIVVVLILLLIAFALHASVRPSPSPHGMGIQQRPSAVTAPAPDNGR